MEDKWIAIMVVGIATAMFAPLLVMEYSQAQCRIEALKVSTPADDIIKVCGK